LQFYLYIIVTKGDSTLNIGNCNLIFLSNHALLFFCTTYSCDALVTIGPWLLLS
jgi:hypothetical protein